ncbi:MAG TPA: serine/threonine-protein kinase, partial [Pirellulales bacterium]|nr:serine/threonine-protein kinase [Pirellulales bacterium]
PELNRPVAIKVPRAGRFATAADADKFLDEARHAAGLKHPAIVAVYDVGRDGLDCHIVMEYVAGRTLEEVLATERLSHMAVARLLALVADALHYAHQKGFVHRDLKPGNIMLEAGGVVRGGGVSGRVVSGRVVSGRVVSGRVVGVVSGTEADGFTSHPSPLTTHPSPKLLDFGLAVSEESQRQLAGKVAGTPAYMAPEQVRGETHRLDGRADIWSLGVIAYQLLTGRQPFWRGDVKACLDEIEQREPKPPRQIDDSIPAELERITLRCLAKRVTDRYTTGRDLAADFRRWLRSQGKRRNVPPPIVEHGTTTAASSDTTPQRSPAANQRLSIAMRWVACAPAARSSIANDGRCRRTSPAANRGSPSQAPRPATAPRPMPSATLPNRFPSQFDRGMCVTC